MPSCSCRMGGSFRLSCSFHGERNTLIEEAKWMISQMSEEELRELMAAEQRNNQ